MIKCKKSLARVSLITISACLKYPKVTNLKVPLIISTKQKDPHLRYQLVVLKRSPPISVFAAMSIHREDWWSLFRVGVMNSNVKGINFDPISAKFAEDPSPYQQQKLHSMRQKIAWTDDSI